MLMEGLMAELLRTKKQLVCVYVCVSERGAHQSCQGQVRTKTVYFCWTDGLPRPPSLTAAELRTCRLAAAGQSNPAIARSLFVTRATVESHLHSSYRKLGIASRGELAAALAEAERAEAVGPE